MFISLPRTAIKASVRPWSPRVRTETFPPRRYADGNPFTPGGIWQDGCMHSGVEGLQNTRRENF